MEGTSSPELWAQVRRSARRIGVIDAFPDSVDASLLDDHIPFIREGVPSVDFIDWQYPHKDTLRDTVDKTAARTLDAVGETVVDVLLHWAQ
jgi:hypothetical protein